MLLFPSTEILPEGQKVLKFSYLLGLERIFERATRLGSTQTSHRRHFLLESLPRIHQCLRNDQSTTTPDTTQKFLLTYCFCRRNTLCTIYRVMNTPSTKKLQGTSHRCGSYEIQFSERKILILQSPFCTLRYKCFVNVKICCYVTKPCLMFIFRRFWKLNVSFLCGMTCVAYSRNGVAEIILKQLLCRRKSGHVQVVYKRCFYGGESSQKYHFESCVSFPTSDCRFSEIIST